MKHTVLMIATSCALAACGGGSDEAAKSSQAQQLAKAPLNCDAGLNAAGDACNQTVSRPTPSQPLETQ